MTVETVALAVETAESHGEWWAVSKSGCVGVMQICPQWSKVPRNWLLIPWINRREGTRLLSYWYKRSHGRWVYALAAYRCGYGGLQGHCGMAYARNILGGDL